MRVVLYQSKISPPCCKIRFLLAFYEVPYTAVEGKKPGSDYAKIPVLDVGERQINDSFIIVKSLAPILQGRPLTDDELEIERQVTYGLMVAAEKHTAGSLQDLCACASLMGGRLGCLLRSTACCVCCIGPRKIGEGKELRSIQAYGDMLREQLGSGLFLGGGDRASVLDASVFGVLEPFARAGSSCVDVLLGPQGDALRSWHCRMQAASSHVDIFRAPAA